jgi:DNA modification methylase
MVLWERGRPGNPAWRCPACSRVRRKDYHRKVEIKEGAPRQEVGGSIVPYLQDPDVTVYHGDALEVLRTLPDQSVHMCATSPPFYGLRDYQVEGQIGLEETPDQWVDRLVAVFREVRRVLRDDGTLWIEIGDSYVSGQGGRQSSVGEMPARPLSLDSDSDIGRDDVDTGSWRSGATSKVTPARGTTDLKPKDLLGQPWLLAFALRADGWYLRSEIIWARPNPMPESVTDRPTKSHSTVFLLSKSPRYFYDQDAIREAFAEPQGGRAYRRYPEGFKEDASGSGRSGRLQGPAPGQITGPQAETLDGSDPPSPPSPNRGEGQGFRWNSPHYTEQEGPLHNTLGGLPPEAPRGPDGRRVTSVKGKENSEQHRDGERWPNPAGANARSVWMIATEPTPFAHFATWPRKLVARMIQAGTSERGCCPECLAPWVRDVEDLTPRTWRDDREGHVNNPNSPERKAQGQSAFTYGSTTVKRALGWSPSCEHGGAPIPCVVLDPFGGAGATGLVARDHNRHAILIELNSDYCKLSAERLGQQSLFTEMY